MPPRGNSPRIAALQEKNATLNRQADYRRRSLKRVNEATSEPWRVGVLFSQSGHMSVIEETQLRGTLLAIDEINSSGGLNGRELMPII
jgi:ABC-type branched-subunit amino acid transport system substrate-binding protein